MHWHGPRFLWGAHCTPLAENSSSSHCMPSLVSSSSSPTISTSSTKTKKEIPFLAFAAFARRRATKASVKPQKRRGESRYPKGRRVAHISLPVPGCLTTSLFFESSPIGTCQKPSRMSYLAKCELGLTTGATSHTDGKVNAAVGECLFVPTE